MFIVALADNPCRSVALTTNVFVPASATDGVPESTPAPETLNQVGPLTLPNVTTSPKSGSLAWLVILAEYACPALATGAVKGLVAKTGGRLLFTLIESEPVAAKPPESTAKTRNVFKPRS